MEKKVELFELRTLKKSEILAPAGSPEGLYGAVQAGADAVYLAGSRFGARAYADNFTQEELVAGIRYAHLCGCKIYVTVNTLMKEAEIAELVDFLRPFYEAGLDGVIVQDLGALAVIRRFFPGLALHASTQMTITSGYGAKWLKALGVSRVVPARELNLQEIRQMKADSGLEIETFIHGAMCYCYSGQCLFSSVLGGRSGNRGRCAQPCRLPYRVCHGRESTPECYTLSLKDMCTIECLPELIEAGIDSFKIEGRMKKPEYTAGVTAIYRKYVDKYYKLKQEGRGLGTDGFVWKISERDLTALSHLYIRSERQDGYYFRRNGREMVTLRDPAYSGSDEALLQRVRERYLSGKRRKHGVTVSARFLTGGQAAVELTASINGRTLTASAAGNLVDKAQKQPITEEQIRRQLAKLGDTTLEAEQFEIHVSGDAFYPLKEINVLRREAAVRLEEQIAEQYGLPLTRRGCETDSVKPTAVRGEVSVSRKIHMPDHGAGAPQPVSVSVSTPGQMHAVTNFLQNNVENCSIARIYLEADLAETIGIEGISTAAGKIFTTNFDGFLAKSGQNARMDSPELVLTLPHIIRNEDSAYLERVLNLARTEAEGKRAFGGIKIRNIDGLGYLREVGYGAEPGEHIFADASFYQWNTEAQAAVDGLDAWCLPLELKAGEQHALVRGSRISCEKLFYGRIPMMVTANCAALTTDGCRKDSGEPYFLMDRYKKQFPVVRNCKHCYNVIYNSLPLSLHREWDKWAGDVTPRLDFTVEDASETSEILRFYTGGRSGEFPLGAYTTGFEKNGVL